MYTENPEEFLQSKGLLYPIEKRKLPPKSPTNLERIEEKKHEMKIEDEKLVVELEDRRWRSCCFDLHQESSLFFAKVSISILVICLCCYQLINLRSCEYQSLYSSLLSSVMTFWLSRSK
jgi:hypothetical protein